MAKGTDNPRLVSLAIIRAALHKDIDTCVLLWRDADDQDAVVAALAANATALLHALSTRLDIDPEQALDRVVAQEVASHAPG